MDSGRAITLTIEELDAELVMTALRSRALLYRRAADANDPRISRSPEELRELAATYDRLSLMFVNMGAIEQALGLDELALESRREAGEEES